MRGDVDSRMKRAFAIAAAIYAIIVVSNYALGAGGWRAIAGNRVFLFGSVSDGDLLSVGLAVQYLALILVTRWLVMKLPETPPYLPLMPWWVGSIVGSTLAILVLASVLSHLWPAELVRHLSFGVLRLTNSVHNDVGVQLSLPLEVVAILGTAWWTKSEMSTENRDSDQMQAEEGADAVEGTEPVDQEVS